MDADQPTVVNAQFDQMNGLQRSAESFRYTILCIERWISPQGTIRVWLRRNVFVGLVLLIPALFVLPVANLILWEISPWTWMFTGIAGKIIFVLLLLVVVRMIKR